MRTFRQVAALCLAIAACAPNELNQLVDVEPDPPEDTGLVDDTDTQPVVEDTEEEDTAPQIVAACEVPPLTDLFSGNLPPDPTVSRGPAPECVQERHHAIIVLGCPTSDSGLPAACQRERVALALRFHAAGYGSDFIVTGGAVANDHVEAEMLAQLLEEEGIAPERIVLEPQAEHTDENLYYSGALMRDRGWSTALVISKPDHLIYAATCDANCCVKEGRLSVLTFPLSDGDATVASYVLYPDAALVSEAECDHIKTGTKLMCTQLASRTTCADD